MNDIKILHLKDKIILDERGWVINLLDIVSLPKESFHYFHVVSMKPGSIRGNHYHTNAKEWLFVCEGDAVIAWRLKDENSISRKLIREGEPLLFEINAEVDHAIKNTSNKDIFLISFSDSKDRETHQSSSLFELII